MKTRWTHLRSLWAGALVVLLLLTMTTPAQAVIVTPGSPDGWAPANVRADATVAITTAQPRSGNGSLEFATNTVTPGQDKADYQKTWDPADFPTRTLAGLTALSYEYYRDSSSTTANHLAPVFRLYVADVTPTSSTFGKYALLIWEPVYNGAAPVPTDQWITQDILNGKFWMFVPSGQSIPSGVVQNYGATLSNWLAGGVTGQPGDPAPINIDANSLVFGVNVGVGSGWGATFRGFVDNVTLRWGTDEVHANFEVDSGSLTVTKVIDWQNVPPIPGATFNICISGPSYPTPFCQTTTGGTISFGPLAPGDYTVSESPGSHWLVAISESPVTVAPQQTAQVTVLNTYVGPQLVCPLLDDFNRANTTKGLGANWTGATNTYRIFNNEVQPFTTAGMIFWNKAPRTFGADQVACVKLTDIDPNGRHHTLILKAQATKNYARGMILVAYDAVNQRVVVETIQPGQSGWVTRLVIPGAFAGGDVLGARALADGSVRVYKNGVLIGAASTSSFFVNRGGRIGVWYHQTANAHFDNFGGGNTTP